MKISTQYTQQNWLATERTFGHKNYVKADSGAKLQLYGMLHPIKQSNPCQHEIQVKMIMMKITSTHPSQVYYIEIKQHT